MPKSLALLVAAAVALGVPTPSGADERAPPRWLRQPVVTAPPLAAALGFEGRVRLRCDVDTLTGSLARCWATSETPGELGFADAAIAGARRARLASPPSLEEAPDAAVEFTIAFRFDETGASPPLTQAAAPAARALGRANALLAERPLPPNLFIPANGVPERWLRAHEQVLREFELPAREVWALVLARSRNRGEHATVLNAGPASYPSHQSELETWGFRHPEAKALQQRMVDRMRALICAEISCGA